MQIDMRRIGKQTGTADVVYSYDIEVLNGYRTYMRIQGTAHADKEVPHWAEGFVLKHVTVNSCKEIFLVNGVWKSSVVSPEYVEANKDMLEAMAFAELKSNKDLQEYCDE